MSRILPSVLLFLPLAASAASAQLAFQPGASLATGLAPRGAAAGDFDGDGRTDVAVSNSNQSVVTILLGSSAGLFVASQVPIPGQATDVVAADFDGDGDLDLATADANKDTVTRLENLGGGVFVVQESVATGKKPRALVVADFDGDGDPDLAFVERGDDTVGFARNDAGVLVSAGSMPVAADPRRLTAADLDGDGAPDLAVAAHAGSLIHVFRNNGGLQFVGAAALPILRPNDVLAADVDGDGASDLLVAQGNATPPLHGVVIFRNAGSFLFQNLGLNPAGIDPHGLVAFDADADGDLDVATAGTASDEVAVLENLGGASFAPAVSIAVGNLPQDVVSGDFDGDGAADLLVTEEGPDTATVLSNQSLQNFLVFGQGCPGTGGVAPALAGIGEATAGGSVTITLGGGLPGAAAVLFVGTRQADVTVAPGCSLLVGGSLLPIALTLDAAGGFSLPTTLPASVPAGTLVLQFAAADAQAANGVFTLSNGLEMNLH